jgi:hypothetical protein
MILDTEALAEAMHDAYVVEIASHPSGIVLWRGVKNDPSKLRECNAWRAAASAAAACVSQRLRVETIKVEVPGLGVVDSVTVPQL